MQYLFSALLYMLLLICKPLSSTSIYSSFHSASSCKLTGVANYVYITAALEMTCKTMIDLVVHANHMAF